MPTRGAPRRCHATPAVEATLSTVEEALNLAVGPIATAIEVPAEDATPATSGKRSRVHEVFIADPNNADYSLCQCVENVKGRSVCGRRIKSSSGTKPLWNHLEKKHPGIHAKLNVKAASDDAGIAHASAAERLQSPAQLTINISYQNMVDALRAAPAEILADAIEALQQA